MSRKEFTKKLILSCLALALVLVAIYSGLQILESTVLSGRTQISDTVPSKTVVHNGVEYFPRQDLKVMMILGIDKFGPVTPSNIHLNDGAADMIVLLVFDETSRECTILHLNRDTMIDVPVLGISGEYAGTSYEQLALAHTYGSGMEDSSENVKRALETWLHGATVDHYLTMHMDAIPILNDAVGGVKVTVVDDFSVVNPSITMGELTLNGEQVIDYVRSRKDVGDQKNVSRMERQKEYVSNFLQALREKENESVTAMVDMYEAVTPYIVTDCSVETFSDLLDRFEDYTVKTVLSPEGENIVKDGHYQFLPDGDKLEQMILDVFYRPKN